MGSNLTYGALVSLVRKGVLFNELAATLPKIENVDNSRNMRPLYSTTPQVQGLNITGQEKVNRSSVRSKKGTRIRKDNATISSNEVLVLREHTDEVYSCSWNPQTNLLASSGADSRAIIWHFPNVFDSLPPEPPSSTFLDHPWINAATRNTVAALSWSPNGHMLATASFDGCTRIWNLNGDLKRTLELQKEPCHSLKWNKTGSRILSGSSDATAAVWDPLSGRLERHFKFHSKAILDVDWRCDTTFATCSKDMKIYLCSVSEPQPRQIYTGHSKEINCIQFCPTGMLLASGSDDCTAKIWRTSSSRCVRNLTGHKGFVNAVQWRPDCMTKLLATASHDRTIKMWDINTGKVARTLARHTSPVYTMDFSPNGQLIATGSTDGWIHVCSTEHGTLLMNYRADRGILTVQWNAAGDKLVVIANSKTVTVLDVRKLVTQIL